MEVIDGELAKKQNVLEYLYHTAIFGIMYSGTLAG